MDRQCSLGVFSSALLSHQSSGFHLQDDHPRYPQHPYSIRNNRHSLNKRYVKHKQILQGEPITQDLNDPRKEVFSLYFLPKRRQHCVKPPLLGRQNFWSNGKRPLTFQVVTGQFNKPITFKAVISTKHIQSCSYVRACVLACFCVFGAYLQ